jgi:hypothetical protein
MLVSHPQEGSRYHLFNGAGAMCSSVEGPLEGLSAPAYAAHTVTAKWEGYRGTAGLNARSLHAGGATHGRGVKRPPCPRPPTNECGDAGFRVSSCLPAELGNQRSQTTRAIPRPRPSISEAPCLSRSPKGAGRMHPGRQSRSDRKSAPACKYCHRCHFKRTLSS